MKKFYNSLCATVLMIVATVSMAVGQNPCAVWMDSLVTEFNDTSFCSTICPSITIYKPTVTGTISWQLSNPFTILNGVDSVIVSSDRVIWFVLNGTPTIGIAVNFVNPLDSLQFLMADQTVCPGDSVTLDPSASPYTDYLWSPSGETIQAITTSDSGLYSVNIANACGSTSSVAHVMNYATTPPSLGPNQTICLNTSVTLDAGPGYITYWWSNDSTTQSIVVDTTGTYSVGTVDVNGCTGSSSMDLLSVLPFETPKICIADFDTATQKNKIYWLSQSGLGIDSITIYKETVQDVWTALGTVANAAGEYVDLTSNPQNSADSYKISVKDTCGNTGPMSLFHTTINLVVSWNPINNILGFFWTHYIGMPGLIPTYTINAMDSTGAVIAIGTVPGNQNTYNYLSPDSNYIKYFISFEATCGDWFKTDQVMIAKSNIVLSTITGIQENPLNKLVKIYPMPSNGRITIQTDLIVQDIKLYDTLGQLLLVTKEKSFEIQYKGILYLHIMTDKGDVVKKIIIQ